MNARSLLTAAAIWLFLVIVPYALGPLWLGGSLDGSFVVAYMIWFVIAATLTAMVYVMHIRESRKQE